MNILEAQSNVIHECVEAASVLFFEMLKDRLPVDALSEPDPEIVSRTEGALLAAGQEYQQANDPLRGMSPQGRKELLRGMELLQDVWLRLGAEVDEGDAVRLANKMLANVEYMRVRQAERTMGLGSGDLGGDYNSELRCVFVVFTTPEAHWYMEYLDSDDARARGHQWCVDICNGGVAANSPHEPFMELLEWALHNS